MAKRVSTRRESIQNNGAAGGTATTALAAGVGASALSGAGGTTLTSCPPEDKSFYCQFVKGFNIFKMILFIIAILVLAYILIKVFMSKKKDGRK